MDPALGTIVEVPVGRGVVRFSGTTSFKPGKWVGIELYEQKGKNDGSVEGVSYFNCKKDYGVFVRASQIKATFGSELDNAPGPSTRPTLGTPRSSMGHQRTSSLARSNSMRTTSPSGSSVRSASPAKPSPASGSLKVNVSRPGQASPTKRGPAAAPRKSFPTPGDAAPTTPIRTTTSPTRFRLQSFTNGKPSPNRVASPLAVPQSPPSPPSPQLEITPPKPSQPIPVDDSELQELRAKIRVLEAKRADDARHVRELESRLSDAESFVALRPKLQAKLQSQQTELIAERRMKTDAEQLAELMETRVLDTQEQLEMAMLDKEVAEERAEIAEAELEEVKEKLAIAEVELDVMKDEREGEEGDVDAAKGSLAYIQLEKQNERLKEALLRLRDITQETDMDQRRRIAEMEKDIATLDELQILHEEGSIKLANAEVQIADLKLQLDDALSAEDMLVQLTERNLTLGEKIEEMRITIEDLEALQELNDELEENHVETEKTLHEDIELKDMELQNLRRQVEDLEETCLDSEGTIEQFRDLVLRLQTELAELRAQTQTAQTESATAASQTAAMMSLNMKLQSSAAKNQAKNIELELKKLEAKETKELLSIVQPYLPQLYIETDSDATSCYLLFQRLAYKTELINTVVADIHNLPKSLEGSGTDTLVGITEMRGRIAGLSVLCKRFASTMRRCDVQSFLNIGRLHAEIAPMERRIDMHINLLRRDEFREMECVSDVIKIQSQFEHLAETYFNGFDYDLGDREYGYLLSFDLDLDVFAAAISLAKTSVANAIKDDEVVQEMNGLDIEVEFFEPMQRLLDLCRSSKTLSRRLTKRLEDLLHDSGALKAHLLPQMSSLSNSVQDAVNFAISLAQQIMPHLGDVRSSKSPFRLATVVQYVRETAASTLGADKKLGMSSWEVAAEALTQLNHAASVLLPSAVEPENTLKIIGVSPWVTRVDEIKASLAVNLEAERKVAQLNDEMQGLLRNLKIKDQSIQESSVKVELMERRIETFKKQGDAIDDMQEQLAKSRKQERAYEEAMDQLQSDLDSLEQENVKLKAQTAGMLERPTIVGPQPVEPDSSMFEGNFETSYLLEQIDALRGTVRYLRHENSYLKGSDLLREIESLPELTLRPPRSPPTPPLIPSTLSDSSDDESDLPSTPPSLRSLTTATKLLYRDVIKFSSSPQVVDLTAINERRKAAEGGKIWMPRKHMPAHHIYERKQQAEKLNRRVKGLIDRASLVSSL